MLVVASERTYEGGWSLMRNGELLIAELSDGRVEYKIRKVVDVG